MIKTNLKYFRANYWTSRQHPFKFGERQLARLWRTGRGLRPTRNGGIFSMNNNSYWTSRKCIFINLHVSLIHSFLITLSISTVSGSFSLLHITMDVKSIVQLQLHGEYPKQLFSEKQREACAVSWKSCGLNYTNIFQLFLLFTQAAFSCFLFDFSWLLPLILLGICFYNLWLTAPKGMVNRKPGICRGIFGKIR